MVRLLWNHPSVAVWCCHNEPFKSLDAITASELLKPDKLKRLLDPATLFMMNNWNKNVLDVTLKGAVAALDPSRPVIPNSGILPAMGEGTDTHFYFGWYMGTMRGFGGLARLSPKNIRFVTEYGAQSFPSMDVFRKMSDASAVADIDWAALSERHMLQKEIMDKFTPPKTGAVEEYIAATQWYQARVVRYHNELLRRYKYSPCGGAVHFMFNDAMPGVTWSVVDSDRIPKQAYAALRDSFRLLLPVADMPRIWYPRGDLISLRLFVINDYESAFPGATLKWAFFNADGAEMASGTEALDIDPDSAYRCGRARWISADAPRGGYAFVLELSGPGIDKPVLNQYEFEIRK